ncbi:MAG: PEP-utilizing enzyme, partial [Candidatus Magasanikiibacteriota bacterium]
MSNKIIWEEIARRGDNQAIFLIDTAAEGFKRGYIGFDHNITEFKPLYYRQLSGARWFSVSDIADYIKFLKDKEINNPGILVEYANEFRHRVETMRNYVNIIKDFDWRNKNNEKLVEVFEKFTNLTRIMWAFAYNYIMVNRFLPDIIFTEIAKKEFDTFRQTEIFNILMQLDDSSETRKEKISLLHIAEIVEKNGYTVEIENKIKKHLQNYEYLGQYYFRGQGYTLEIIRQRINQILQNGVDKEWEKIKKTEIDVKNSEIIKKDLGLNKNVLLYIDSARAQTWISNFVDESYTYAVYYLKPLFIEISTRLSISYKYLLEMRGSEIINSLLQGKLVVPIEQLDQRLIESAIILDHDEIKILIGSELEEYKKQELQNNVYEDIRELTGQGASSGLAKGLVKLVLCDADASKVEKGDILLAPATNPTLVPAMERAGAIVTDEGGLLSHAAIVSRELGIPCLVGTKIGTKVFRDGDRVEVDTQRGVIQKIF